jgi:hypothetical protein
VIGFLTTEPWVQFQLTSDDICGGHSVSGSGIPPSFFCFTLLIIILSLLHTHLSPPLDVCYISDQAVHYHIFSLYVGGFISDLVTEDITVLFIDEHNVLWIMSVMPFTTSQWLLVPVHEFLTVLRA